MLHVQVTNVFLPRGAVLTRYILWRPVSPSVCLAVTRKGNSGVTRNSGPLDEYPSRALPLLSQPSLPFRSLPSPYLPPLSILRSGSGRSPAAKRTSVQFTDKNLQICDYTVRLGCKPELGVLQ